MCVGVCEGRERPASLHPLKYKLTQSNRGLSKVLPEMQNKRNTEMLLTVKSVTINMASPNSQVYIHDCRNSHM